MKEKIEALEIAEQFIFQPFVITALLEKNVSTSALSDAIGIEEGELIAACEVWGIDVDAVLNEAVKRARRSVVEKEDADITPFRTAVECGCDALGWDIEDFICAYKVFRANRQSNQSKSVMRPARFQRFNMNNKCQLNLMEFFMLWAEKGRDSFLQRGKRKAEGEEKSQALQVMRVDHEEPYRFSNCVIGTQNENMREMHQRERPGQRNGQAPILINGFYFSSRSVAKKTLNRSESWICTNEGDYQSLTYRLNESHEVLVEQLSSQTSDKIQTVNPA